MLYILISWSVSENPNVIIKVFQFNIFKFIISQSYMGTYLMSFNAKLIGIEKVLARRIQFKNDLIRLLLILKMQTLESNI